MDRLESYSFQNISDFHSWEPTRFEFFSFHGKIKISKKRISAEQKSFLMVIIFLLANQFLTFKLSHSPNLQTYCRAASGRKIKWDDENVIGGVVEELKAAGLCDDALIVIISDHGTTLGRRNWPMSDYIYEPLGVGELDNTHSRLYDVDLRLPLIINYQGMPEKCKGQKIKGQLRTIDVPATVMDILGIPEDQRPEMDGVSVVPSIENLKGHEIRAYSEVVWSACGMGSRQSLREDNWKYIRYMTSMCEEFFDLQKDPKEQVNLVERLKNHAPRWLRGLREGCNDHYRAEPRGIQRREMPSEEKAAIKARLKELGYITGNVATAPK